MFLIIRKAYIFRRNLDMVRVEHLTLEDQKDLEEGRIQVVGNVGNMIDTWDIEKKMWRKINAQ